MDLKNDKKRKIDDHNLSKDFFQTLSSTQVQSLKTKDNKIFVCTREDNLVDVWKGLSKFHFRSVPVLQKTKKKYYGIIDIHDVMNFVLDYFGTDELQSIDNFWSTVEKSEKLKTITINNVMQYPKSNSKPFNPVNAGYSLYYAMEILSKEEKVERVPIINKDRNLRGILTSTRVLEYLHENKNILGNRLDKPIHLMGSSNSGVFSIKESDKAMNAFKLMRDNNLSCVAIENNEGSLTGVISQSDIKSISEDGSLFYKLFQDAKSFVELINPNKSKIEIISVLPSDKFESVIDLLHTHKLHQIFVINNHSEQKAIGVITIKDLIKDILHH